MKMNLLKAAVLAVAMTIYCTNIYGQQSEIKTYKLVTNQNQLEEGQYLIVGYKNTGSVNTDKTIPKGYYALGLQQNSNNRLGVLIDSISENYKPPLIINTQTASNKNDNLPFEIYLEKNNNKWTLLDAFNSSDHLGPDTTINSLNYLKPNKIAIPLFEITIQENFLSTMACVAPFEAQSKSGRNFIRFNQGGSTSGTLNNPVFACYNPSLSNLNTDIYLYKQTCMHEFWLSEDQTASFTDNAWRVKFGNSVDWEKDENGNFLLISIPQNNSQIQKIKISGIATTGNNITANYITDILEIDLKGSLEVSAGTLDVLEKAVIHADDNHSAQLKSTNGILTTNELHVRKTFRNAAWYHVSFPFDVEKIYLNKENNSSTEEVTINPNASKGVWAKEYNGEARALADKNPEHYNPENSVNWISVPEGTKLEANKGYQIGQNHGFKSIDTLTFISKSPAPESAWSATEKSYKVIPYEASILHRGWNLIGNPHTFSYDLKNKLSDYITYVYNESNNDYIEDTEIIPPFKAFFVQTEKNEILFHPHHDTDMLRSSSAYEQIRLSITKDSTFFDYFSLRITNNATTEFDLNIDAHKMLSSTNHQIFSRLRNTDYAVSAIPNTEKSIPLAYKVPSAGSYVIRLEKSELSGNRSKLLLIDKERNNLTTNLSVTPVYEFSTTGAQTNTNRFELLFERQDHPQPTKLSPPAIANYKTAVNLKNNLLIIENLAISSTIKVYDITGKMIYTSIVEKQCIISLQSGVYILKVENENQIETMKIIIK